MLVVLEYLVEGELQVCVPVRTHDTTDQKCLLFTFFFLE